MARLRLLHWKATEAAPRMELLRSAGHEVLYEDKPTPASVRSGSPEAILIDLTRMPSHGREVAVHLRGTKACRHIPLIFVGGEAAKVAPIRELIPDAQYATWENVLPAIREAIARPAAHPIVPPQMMSRYGDRTLAQKLGITSGAVVTVIDGPGNYTSLLGELPEGVQLNEDERHPGSVTLWFIHDAVGYQTAISRRRGIAKKSKLWIVRPKGEAGKRVGITEKVVRQTALDAGLVDYKICSVSDIWTGMLFAAAKGS